MAVLVTPSPQPWNAFCAESLANAPWELEVRQSLLSRLPVELLALFVSFLAQSDLASFSEVSKLCCAITRSTVKTIQLVQPTPAAAFVSLLKHFPRLHRLEIAQPANLGNLEMLGLSRQFQLSKLVVHNINLMENGDALLRSLWSLKNLTSLELDFGEYTSSNQNYHSISCMVTLTKLEHLDLRNVPPFWNDAQASIAHCTKNLISLNISYTIPPTHLDFLAPLSKLRFLHLGVIGHEQGSLAYKLPALPSLEILEAAGLGFSASSLEQLSALRYLDFTPWQWKGDDLNAFARIPQLDHLRLRVTWMPDADCLARAFAHLTTLILVKFDVRLLHTLQMLKNLRSLAIDQPTRRRKPVKSEDLRLLASTLQALPGITSFALTGVPHLSHEIQHAIISKKSNIFSAELSGCCDCLEEFVNAVCSHEPVRLRQILFHLPGGSRLWTYGSNSLETVSVGHSAFCNA